MTYVYVHWPYAVEDIKDGVRLLVRVTKQVATSTKEGFEADKQALQDEEERKRQASLKWRKR